MVFLPLFLCSAFTVIGHITPAKKMAAILDSSRRSPSPKRGYSSSYKDAHTQTSRRDRASYHRMRVSEPVVESRSRQEIPAAPGTIPRSWRSSTQSTQRAWRASILSQSGSLHKASGTRDPGVRDWEADLAAFRMSWHDEAELFDANTWKQAEDGNEAEDSSIVEWDGPADPTNPLNWSNGRKWANIITFSTITMIRQLAPHHFVQTHPIHH